MAFAAAICVSTALPRWSFAFFAWAFLVALERILENAHYVSDVVAGAGLGILCGCLAIWLSRRLIREATPHSFDVSEPDRPLLQMTNDQ